MTKTTNAPTTTEIEHVVAIVLSCNHTLHRSDGHDMPSTQGVGAPVGCPKCKPKKSGEAPTRRIRRCTSARIVVPVDPPAMTEAEVFEAIAAPVSPAIRRTTELVTRRPITPVVDGEDEEVTPGNYDLATAKAEHAAVRAWIAGGRQGDAPTTLHLDALNAAHAAGRPRGGQAKAPRKARNTDQVRLDANAARKAKGTGGRHNQRRLDAEELLGYVAARVMAHPASRSVDLRDYALWVDEVSVSFKRWDIAYEAVALTVVTALMGAVGTVPAAD
mgnify:CR=1 FL=1